ncbi:hypothetical protein ACIODS_33085 [Micromonospora chalcea]|uniref:hypothetical protein n=1 Tax=Micromonospora chalcea TaxID=1874 RepID=UPI00380E96A3
MKLAALRRVLAKALPELLALVPKEEQSAFLKRLSRLLAEADDVETDDRLLGLFAGDEEAVAQARLTLDDLEPSARPPILAGRNAPVHGARHVNTCFAGTPGGPALPATACLAAATTYHLRVDIGPWSEQSIVENPVRFPDEELPPTRVGYWLTAAVTSEDFAVDSSEQPIFLPVEGRAWTCTCSPGTRHTCRVGERSPFLFFPVTAPAEPGRAELRLTVTHRGGLVQSQLVTTDVRPREGIGFGAHARIDYSLGGLLDQVNSLPSRGVNVTAAQAIDGSHVLTIGGLGPKRVSVRLHEGQMSSASDAARWALRDLQEGQSRRNGWRAGRSRREPAERLSADLARLAPLGYQLWNLLFNDQPQRRAELGRWLREPTTIQVGRAGRTGMVFPWALVYDIALEHGNPRAHHPCRVVEAMPSPAPPRCPYETEHRLNTLCPYGFWGMRHFIEQPPSLEGSRSLPTRIGGTRPSVMAVGIGPRLDTGLAKQHLSQLDALRPAIEARCCTGRASFIRTLAQPDLSLVYLYCHGRRQLVPGAVQPVPYLELGDDERLFPSDLTALHDYEWPEDHWADTSPLVFINSCHSVEITPSSLAQFVDAFCGIYAGGVIGVETVVEQSLAGRVAEVFWSSFGVGRTVGESLARVKLELLGVGDLFGLAYTAYCSTDLRLGTVRAA